MLKIDLTFDSRPRSHWPDFSPPALVNRSGGAGSVLGAEEGIFKQISWKRLNVNSITWEGLKRAESWPEPDFRRREIELRFCSPRLHWPNRTVRVCFSVWEKKLSEISQVHASKNKDIYSHLNKLPLYLQPHQPHLQPVCGISAVRDNDTRCIDKSH